MKVKPTAAVRYNHIISSTANDEHEGGEEMIGRSHTGLPCVELRRPPLDDSMILFTGSQGHTFKPRVADPLGFTVKLFQ